MKAQIGNRSGEEYRFALENTSLCTKPNCGTSLCVQVSLLWSDFYLLSFVLSFFVNIIRYLVFHQPKLSKEGIWNLLGWEFRWGCDGLMPIGARRRRPPTIFPPTRVFTTLKANTNINSNTIGHVNEKYSADQFKHMFGSSPASAHSEHSEFLGKNTCILADFF